MTTNEKRDRGILINRLYRDATLPDPVLANEIKLSF